MRSLALWRLPRVGAPSSLWGAALFCVCAAVGCAKKPAELAKLELSTVPQFPIKLGQVFGGKLELLGAKVVTPPQGLKANGHVEISLYWRKLGALPAGFRLFTHVLDDAGERILNLDAVGPLRKQELGQPLYPPSSWEEGKIYVDSVAFWVPALVRTDSIRVVCGVYREGERLRIDGRPPGPEAERAQVTKLSLVRSLPTAASSPVPVLWLLPRRSPIQIDGKLDELAWTQAANAGPFVNASSGEPATSREVTGSVKLLYDEQALYVGFDVIDEDLRGGFDPAQSDPHLWLKDTVELMIDPDGDGDNLDYYEIQVSPQNLVFDSQFDAYNAPRGQPDGPYGHQEWSAQLKSAVELRGTLDDQLEDDGYSVELSIPWASFSRAKRLPPTTLDTWRMNFYVMQNNSGSAWSPLLGQGNFHKASRFGRVRFAGRSSSRP